MPLVNSTTKLSDIVLADTSIVTVLNRFGIALGLGDMTIEDACQAHNIDKDFFAVIINTCTSAEYFPEKILGSFKASLIVDYLSKTNRYYEQFMLPNIERHFQLLMSKSETVNGGLLIAHTFFNEVKEQLTARNAADMSHWFPEIIRLEKAHDEPLPEAVITEFDDETDTVEDKLNDLISMFVIHVKADYDWNLGYAVLFALTTLQRDLVRNNRIRNRILMPLSKALRR